MSLPLPAGSLLRAFFRNAAISPAEDVSCTELAFPVVFSLPFVMHQYLETSAADARWDIDARNEFVSIGENLQVTDFCPIRAPPLHSGFGPAPSVVVNRQFEHCDQGAHILSRRPMRQGRNTIVRKIFLIIKRRESKWRELAKNGPLRDAFGETATEIHRKALKAVQHPP